MQYFNRTFTVLQASPGSCISCLAKMRHQKSAGSHCLGKHQICQIFLWQIFFKITWPLKRSSELSVSFLDPGTQFKIYIKIHRSFSKEIISLIYKFSFLKAFFFKGMYRVYRIHDSLNYALPLTRGLTCWLVDCTLSLELYWDWCRFWCIQDISCWPLDFLRCRIFPPIRSGLLIAFSNWTGCKERMISDS